MKEIYIMDFVQEVKEVYGTCSIIDQIPIDDLFVFSQFTSIVWNYIKMKEILNS